MTKDTYMLLQSALSNKIRNNSSGKSTGFDDGIRSAKAEIDNIYEKLIKWESHNYRLSVTEEYSLIQDSLKKKIILYPTRREFDFNKGILSAKSKIKEIYRNLME